MRQDLDKQKIILQYQNGASISKLSQKWKASRSTIYNIVKQIVRDRAAAISKQRGYTNWSVLPNDLLQFVLSNYSYQDGAKILGVTKSKLINLNYRKFKINKRK